MYDLLCVCISVDGEYWNIFLIGELSELFIIFIIDLIVDLYIVLYLFEDIGMMVVSVLGVILSVLIIFGIVVYRCIFKDVFCLWIGNNE